MKSIKSPLAELDVRLIPLYSISKTWPEIDVTAAFSSLIAPNRSIFAISSIISKTVSYS